jgi:hypothetical protein
MRKTMSAARFFSAACTVAVLAACRESTGPPADPAFDAPIVGTPMEDVFYGAYIDHDPASSVRDWACGIKAYDGHTGVDILLRNFRVQDEGVPVIAAADGTVASTGDGLPDRSTTWDSDGLGNYVTISHPGGLTTRYGHLRRGSISVTPGERVRRGARLGLVGSSGKSNWPHLHFDVRRDGAVVEPFSGACSPAESLWADQLAYQNAFMVTDAGVTDQPATRAVLLERPPTLAAFPLDATGFRFWLQVANQPEATVRFEVRAPSGARPHAVELRVDSAFSMRYLALDVPVRGTLTEAGAWEIQTFQDGQLIWTQPFTLLPAAAMDAAGAPYPRVRSTFDVRVLDQTPPGTGAHP